MSRLGIALLFDIGYRAAVKFRRQDWLRFAFARMPKRDWLSRPADLAS
jgi:hypothetical protein